MQLPSVQKKMHMKIGELKNCNGEIQSRSNIIIDSLQKLPEDNQALVFNKILKICNKYL